MKITLKLFLLSIGFSLFSFLTACVETKKSEITADIIDQGVIEYAIIWPKNMSNLGFSFLLPKSFTMTFNSENQRYTTQGAMSLYTFELIKSSKSDTLFTMLEAINQKNYTTTSISQELNRAPILKNWRTVILKDSVKLIHDLECTKALLFEQYAISPSMTVWFTNRIPSKHLYNHTLFKEVPGAIIELIGNYNSHYYGIKATSITEKEYTTDWFETPPADYQLVKKEEIEERLMTLFK